MGARGDRESVESEGGGDADRVEPAPGVSEGTVPADDGVRRLAHRDAVDADDAAGVVKFRTAGRGELTEHIEPDVGIETSVEVRRKRRRAPPERGERSGDEALAVPGRPCATWRPRCSSARSLACG